MDNNPFPPDAARSARARLSADEPATARAGWVMFLLVLALALAHRVYLATSTDFPINDGGLFYVFLKATAATFPALPESVPFNGLVLPFAYPPLSFWLGAMLVRIGADALDVVHFLPIASNALYVLLFALLLLRSGRSPLFSAVALVFFCTTMRSFEWLVMGGGLSRGIGAVFLIATLLAVRVPPPGERFALPPWRSVLAGACVAGAILSHLEWGINAAGAVVLARLLGSSTVKEFLRSTVLAGITAFVLIAPWLLFIHDVHGLGPFLAAGQTSEWGKWSVISRIEWLAEVSLKNPLLPIGALVLFARRDYFWLAFLALVIVATPRHSFTPAALAFGIFSAQALFWLFGLLRRRLRSPQLAGSLAAGLALLVVAFHVDSRFLARGGWFRPLSPEAREAMDWVARRHPGQRFVVLTSRRWYYDSSAEWFPVLAGAISLNTVQGREWLPDQAFAKWDKWDAALKTSRTCDRLFEVLGAHDKPRLLWAERSRECFESAGYQALYRNRVVTIFEFKEPPIRSAER